MAERTRAPLVFSARVAASPERVFDAFVREPQRWLCREARIDARVGGGVRLCWPDGCVEGRFVQCEPHSVIRFSWRMQGDSLPETMVVVRVAPASGAEGATDLEVEHYGFGVGEQWDLAYVGAARAWAAYLKNLRAVLEANKDLREPFE